MAPSPREVSLSSWRLRLLATSSRLRMHIHEVGFHPAFHTVANRFTVEQEVARQKILPFSSYWARNSPYGTPVGALTFHWIFSVILILASKLSQVR